MRYRFEQFEIDTERSELRRDCRRGEGRVAPLLLDPHADRGSEWAARPRGGAIGRVFELKPNFSARVELRKWNAAPADLEHILDGLRKSALRE